MSQIIHASCFPDRAKLLERIWFKDPGTFGFSAPAAATFLIMRMVSSGAQGEFARGNGAFARRMVKVNPPESYIAQVGATGSAGNAGHSFVRRLSDGAILCLADRARGAGQSGRADYSVGDYADSGVDFVRSGTDLEEAASLGFGGRYAAGQQIRSAGPGGGGVGNVSLLGTIDTPAGPGCIVAEFFRGDPGF